MYCKLSFLFSFHPTIGFAGYRGFPWYQLSAVLVVTLVSLVLPCTPMTLLESLSCLEVLINDNAWAIIAWIILKIIGPPKKHVKYFLFGEIKGYLDIFRKSHAVSDLDFDSFGGKSRAEYNPGYQNPRAPKHDRVNSPFIKYHI